MLSFDDFRTDGMFIKVTAGTQPSFLQHAVFVENDETRQSMTILGEVSRRFVVSPDVDALLDEMEHADVRDRMESLRGAQPMDED